MDKRKAQDGLNSPSNPLCVKSILTRKRVRETDGTVSIYELEKGCESDYSISKACCWCHISKFVLAITCSLGLKKNSIVYPCNSSARKKLVMDCEYQFSMIMDKLTNWTHGTNISITLRPGPNCVSEWEKLPIITPPLVSINQDLKWFFLLHTNGFGCLFFVLAFYTFLSILHLRSLISSRLISNRPFTSTINIFLCMLGTSRAVCLFVDPYNLKDTMPKLFQSIVWDIGFPCVTSAFGLIQLAFLQSTKLKCGPEILQDKVVLTAVITSHFFYAVVCPSIAPTTYEYYVAKCVVQTVFIIWSIFLYFTVLHAGYKIIHLLQTVPNSVSMGDSSNTHQKGIMQLAMLAPYNNLPSSVVAALVPTLLNPKNKDVELTEPATFTTDSQGEGTDVEIAFGTTLYFTCRSKSDFHTCAFLLSDNNSKDRFMETSKKEQQVQRECGKSPCKSTLSQDEKTVPVSTVPEVHVRPPTPTPSTANVPIITVSSPSRRSSVASRRDSDASRSSRRNSECSVRFINEEDRSTSEYRRYSDFSPRHSPEIDRRRSPDGMARRNSESVTPLGSVRDLRRCSDFSHEKNRSSQFAAKLKRNSDFGNRTPRRMLPPNEHHKLSKVVDLSPAGSRRNSDVSGSTSRTELRRNSDISFRRNSELVQVKPLDLNRRSSDISIRSLSRTPTHGRITVPVKMEIQEKSESDSDQPDCSEKAALMAEKDKYKDDDGRSRKKNLSWKNEKEKEHAEDITVETNLLPENTKSEGKVTNNDFMIHSILNHTAYVNRTKSDTPLQMLEANTAAIRRSKIPEIPNATYVTAILGIILCIADVARIFGPYGLLAETMKYGTPPTILQYPRPLPWFMYQNLCRSLELIMGWAMASITKQLLSL